MEESQNQHEQNPPYCSLSEERIVKFESQHLMYSDDGGKLWQQIPWTPSLKIRIFAAMGNFAWPPVLDCFGWRKGKISVAWHSTFEEELNISKYVGTFDRERGKWSMEVVGRFDLSDGVIRTWFENVGFDAFTRTSR